VCILNRNNNLQICNLSTTFSCAMSRMLTRNTAVNSRRSFWCYSAPQISGLHSLLTQLGWNIQFIKKVTFSRSIGSQVPESELYVVT